MNWLDIVLLVPIAFFAWRGFSTGIIGEVLGLVGLIAGIFITFAYMKPASVMFESFFENPDYAVIAAGVTLFVGTLIAFQLLAWFLKSVLKLAKLNSLNRIAGLGFGVLKASVVLSAALLLLVGFRLPPEQIRNESVLYPVVTPVAPAIYNIVAAVYPGVESFKDTIDEALDASNPLRLLPFMRPGGGNGGGNDRNGWNGRNGGEDDANSVDGSEGRDGSKGTGGSKGLDRFDADEMSVHVIR